MKTSWIKIIACVLCWLFAGFLLANEPILEVGGNLYSRAQIEAVMAESGYDSPEPAVEKLQRDNWLAAQGETAESLYQEMFASASSEFTSMPPLDNELVCNRHYIFFRWLREAARNVPVRHLDIDDYFQIIAETDMFRVRAAHGSEMKARDIQYTLAELQVNEGDVLARSNGVPYLTGREYNDHVAENYDCIRLQFNRDTKLAEVHRALVREAVEGKVVDGFVMPAGAFSSEEAELQAGALMEQESFRGPIRLHDASLQGTRQMLDAINALYREQHRDELTALQLALSGRGNSYGFSFPFLNLYRQCKVGAQKKTIALALSTAEVEAWRTRPGFPSVSSDEARQLLAEAKFNELVSQAVRELKIK